MFAAKPIGEFVDAAPDDQDPRPGIPGAGGRDADRRGLRHPCAQGLHLLRDGVLVRGRDGEHPHAQAGAPADAAAQGPASRRDVDACTGVSRTAAWHAEPASVPVLSSRRLSPSVIGESAANSLCQRFSSAACLLRSRCASSAGPSAIGRAAAPSCCPTASADRDRAESVRTLNRPPTSASRRWPSGESRWSSHKRAPCGFGALRAMKATRDITSV